MSEVDPGKLAPLAAALNQVDREIRLLITAELQETLTSAQVMEALAADRVRAAQKALDAPQARISELDAQIGDAEAERAKLESDAVQGDREFRVKVRQMIPVIDEDIALLAAEKRRLEAEIMPLVAEHAEAKRDLGEAHENVALVEVSMSFPFLGLGQQTLPYSMREHYGLCSVLMEGNRDHPEWNAGIRFLEKLCLRTGYRTDGLPSEAEQVKRYWDSVYDSANQQPETTVHNVNQPENGLMIVGKGDGIADDYRKEVPTVRAGEDLHHRALRETVTRPDRDYMDAPKVPQEYRVH